jgi:hypothetical protein
MVGSFTSPLVTKPTDRTANKAIYLLVATDPTIKTKLAYYKVVNVVESPYWIEIKGWLLKDKAQADSVAQNPYAKSAEDMVEINRRIPWHAVQRIDNINYKKPKAQGE